METETIIIKVPVKLSFLLDEDGITGLNYDDEQVKESALESTLTAIFGRRSEIIRELWEIIKLKKAEAEGPMASLAFREGTWTTKE